MAGRTVEERRAHGEGQRRKEGKGGRGGGVAGRHLSQEELGRNLCGVGWRARRRRCRRNEPYDTRNARRCSSHSNQSLERDARERESRGGNLNHEIPRKGEIYPNNSLASVRGRYIKKKYIYTHVNDSTVLCACKFTVQSLRDFNEKTKSPVSYSSLSPRR